MLVVEVKRKLQLYMKTYPSLCPIKKKMDDGLGNVCKLTGNHECGEGSHLE